MPPTVFMARPPRVAEPSGGPAPSRLPGFREAALNALFPFLVDGWLEDQRLFFRQLAHLARAGIPLYQALESMQRSARSVRMRLPVAAAVQTVADGGRLSDSFARYPECFSELQTELLRAGEEGGFLEKTLDRLTVQVEKELALRRFLSRQTLYSKIILVFAVVVIPAVFAYISGGDPIRAIVGPLVTALQLAVTCAVVFAVGGTWLVRAPGSREAYETVKWRLPGIGRVSRTYALARFGQALSGLYEAGVQLSAALRVAGRASGSFRVNAMAERAAEAADRGEPFIPVMRAAGFVPEDTLNLLETGASTGEIDVMMVRAAEHLEAEAETKAHQAAYIFGTVVFLLVALYVTGLLPLLLGLVARFLPL